MVYATLCPEHALRESLADHIWKGDYIRDDQIDSEFAAYDLLGDKSILPIWTSRGCPYSCSYCASGILNPLFIQRDPVRVYEEIVYCRRNFGTRNFVFYDDALLYDSANRIKKLLRIIISGGERLNFYTPNGLHAKFIDEELSSLLREAGFMDLRLSLETSDEKVQRVTGDKVSNDDIKRAVLLLKEAGFDKKDIGIYIITGAPWIDIKKTMKDISFVNSLGAKAILASYSPIPGTKDYELLLKNGIMEIDTDPLWHNKVVFSELLRPGMVEEIKNLRRYVSKINI